MFKVWSHGVLTLTDSPGAEDATGGLEVRRQSVEQPGQSAVSDVSQVEGDILKYKLDERDFDCLYKWIRL